MTVIDRRRTGGEPLSDELSDDLAPGTEVEVRNRFDGRWAGGFLVAARADAGYRVRRVSDGRELPTVFDGHDVRRRRERKRNSWWY